MNENELFELVKRHIIDVVPTVEPEQVVLSAVLANLGANSVDRADIISDALDELDLPAPFTEFFGLRTVGEIVERLHVARPVG